MVPEPATSVLFHIYRTRLRWVLHREDIVYHDIHKPPHRGTQEILPRTKTAPATTIFTSSAEIAVQLVKCGIRTKSKKVVEVSPRLRRTHPCTPRPEKCSNRGKSHIDTRRKEQREYIRTDGHPRGPKKWHTKVKKGRKEADLFNHRGSSTSLPPPNRSQK